MRYTQGKITVPHISSFFQIADVFHEIYINFYHEDTNVLVAKYSTRKIHTRLHPGPNWRLFHNPYYFDDVISFALLLMRATCIQNGKRNIREQDNAQKKEKPLHDL